MNETPNLSRRAFLQALPAITAGTAILPAQAAGEDTPPHWAMLVDVRRCIGCQACTVGCIMENAVPEKSFRTIVSAYAVKTGETTGTYVLPRLCNHCDNPPCIATCPVDGATFKREDGVVLVDSERCIGCGYCVQGCPYGARFINKRSGKADKCTFCAHRIEAGLLPACVETCVGGARVFGDLNDPGGELRQRLDAAKGEVKVLKPEMGTQPNVYYVGLDPRFQDEAQGIDTLWRPSEDGGLR